MARAGCAFVPVVFLKTGDGIDGEGNGRRRGMERIFSMRLESFFALWSLKKI